jgi:hypothetical protein
MEKNRKVLADRTKPQLDHLLRAAADDYVILVLDRQTEELVSNRTADSEDFHGTLCTTITC